MALAADVRDGGNLAEVVDAGRNDAMGVAACEQTQKSLLVTGVTMLIGLIYWAVVIHPQKGRAWNLKDPVLDHDD